MWKHVRLMIALGSLTLAAGCLTEEQRRRPVPSEVREGSLVDNNQPRKPYEPVDPQMILALKETLRTKSCLVQVGGRTDQAPVNVLAISGGGAYGAFDVGVLEGWSASGARPVFDVVTGISTGAFIATFAFLGPQYDDYVRDMFINSRTEDIYETRLWISILSSSSIATSKPLKKRLEAAITPAVLKEVAKAHEQGRRLYIGTTDLDTRRFVIWDMGAIAASGKPDAIDLYRKIVLASGSVPGFFPPVLIDVEIDGVKYQELHVDGGATTSVFVPMAMPKHDAKRSCRQPGSCIYVISSGKLYADSQTVKQQFVDVTVDAISSMLYAGSRGDVFRIFNTALFCGMDFQLIAVPQEFALNTKALDIDPQELRRLYDLGFEMGKTRKGWRQTPPGAEISEQVLPRTGTQFRTEKERLGSASDAKATDGTDLHLLAPPK
jgi:hypothetical protein